MSYAYVCSDHQLNIHVFVRSQCTMSYVRCRAQSIACNHSRNRHEEVVRYLVTEGLANSNAKDKDGWTPLSATLSLYL